MAGKKRFAAIFGLLTVVVAITGGGVYCYVNNLGLPYLSGEAGPDPSEMAAPLSAADLEAVASAWALPAETSANARSASTGPSTASERDASLGPAPRYADRYTSYEAAVPDHPQFAEPEHVVVTPPTAREADDTQEAPLATLDDPEPAIDPQAAAGFEPAEEGEYLARGQAPGETLGEIEAIADDEPNELRLPEGEPRYPASAERAREAFRDGAQPAAGRYGSGPAPRQSGADAGDGSQMVNPFASRPGGTRSDSSSPDGDGLIPEIEPQPINSALPGRAASPFAADGPAPIETARRDGGSPYAAGFAGPGEFTAAPSYAGSANSAADHRMPMGSAGSSDSWGGAPATADGAGASAGRLEGTGRPGERALEGPQKPALMIQKIAPAEIQVGKAVKFIVQVRNVGHQSAEDVVIRDAVPQGTRLVGTTPSAQANGDQLVWQLGKLSAGEERTVEMQLMPTTEGDVGSVATVSYSAQASVKTRCTMPQLAIRMTAPSEVMVGQEQRVKIELHNPGSGDATGVMLFENVPENVRHAAGPALEFEIGTLPAGQTRELELVLLAEKAGRVVNILSARADGNLQVEQQVEFEVIAPALAVAVEGPTRRYLERPATYQVSVVNPGSAPARDVQLVTKLPKGMQFVRADNMGEYDAGTHAVYWSLAELPEGERGVVELVTMPIEAGAQTLEVEGRAQQGISDQTKQQIYIEGLAAIMFEVRDVEDPIEIGGETSYDIRVVNQGTKAASNVQVVVHLQPGLQMISAEGETRHAQQGAAIVFEPLAQLLPKAETLYRVHVKGVRAGDQRVAVEVKTDDLEQPIRNEESTRVFGDE